ncbi:DUF4328 domain-containing protein [Myxococcota bacterium]|nr:DUF4328 domain-containing protein [Myxococcota bacterium]
MSENPFEPGASVLENVGVGPEVAGFLAPRTAVIGALGLGAVVEGVQVPMLVLGDDVDLSSAWVIAGGLQIAVYVVTVVLWCLWTHRAASNVRVWARDLEYTPGWAVGWYFIPFANLIKPLHAMREIYNASDRERTSYLAADVPMLTGWWGLWVANNLIGNLSARLDSPVLSIAGCVVGVFSAIAAIGVVRAVNARQLASVSVRA